METGITLLAHVARAFVLSTALVLLAGCAATSYHNNSFTATIPGEAPVKLPEGVASSARFAADFDAEVIQMYADGHELVGFAKFTSLLAPQFAERDARLAAEARGATVALLMPPEPSKLNQRSYVTSFWRPVSNDRFILGAYYQDLPPIALGAVGCHNNVVMLGPVIPGTPAAEMGLARDDAIIFVGDTRIVDARSLDEVLAEKAGQSVDIRYIRNGQRYVTSGALARAAVVRPQESGKLPLGLMLVEGPIQEPLAAEVGREKGVFVDGVAYASLACEAGFRTSDLVVSISGKKIGDLDDAAAALKNLAADTEVTVIRGLKPQQVLLASTPRESRERLGIQEAALRQPWHFTEGKSWTWLTVSGMVVSSAAGAYVQNVRNERVRIEEYNREQARAALSTTPHVSIGTGPRGSSVVSSRSGDIYYVDRSTALMLQNNPGYYVQSGNRGGMEIFNAAGRRVPQPGKPSGIVLPSNYDNAWLKNLRFGDSLQQVFGSQDVRRAPAVGQDWSGSSIKNPGWASGVYYDTGDRASWQGSEHRAIGDNYDRRNNPRSGR
jgi:membrane-associated protease RseP (regulator of RpoE activity)